jgi:predicted nucleic acid-binding protein
VSGSRGPWILDSYALLAYLGGEPGRQRVDELLRASAAGKAELYLCLINYGEILYIIERERGLPQTQLAIAAIDQLPLGVVQASRELTFAAAHVKARFGLAYADCFAVALAQALEGTVVTGDPEFSRVSHLVGVEWIPQAAAGQ